MLYVVEFMHKNNRQCSLVQLFVAYYGYAKLDTLKADS